MRFSPLLPLSLWLLASPLPLLAAPVAPPVPDVPAALEHGLTLRLAAGERADTRDARLVAIFVPQGEPVSPFLPTGPFSARWEGNLMSPSRAEYTISAEVRGAFRLMVNGELILEGAGDSTVQTMDKTIELKEGANRLEAELFGSGEYDALVQLKWSARDFPAEPIPPEVFQHDAGDRELREGRRLREGRTLFTQHQCASCHAGGDLLPSREQGTPELWYSAPSLDAAGSRFRENFLAHWINDPRSIRPHSRMPRVFTDGPRDKVDQRAADIAAYLASLGKQDETAPAPENAPLGGALFAELGCIACHSTPNYAGEDPHDRVPLSHVRAKWQPPALKAYLRDPAKHNPHTRMPDFRLTEEEAERLTSYLLETSRREFPPFPKGDAGRGERLLSSAGCTACHGGAPAAAAPKLAQTLSGDWLKGCLSEDAATRGHAPDFAFTSRQRDALRAFASSGLESLGRDVAIEFTHRQMKDLRCNACHSRDGQESVWSQVEREMKVLQGGAPNSDAPLAGDPVAAKSAPVLTWAGEKLKPEWITKLLLGSLPYKPRPWLLARMPAFPGHAHRLPIGFSHEHGLPLADEPTDPNPDLAKVGGQLLGEDGGFNCLQCHAFGDRNAAPVVEAPGLDFAHTRERLRHDYYLRWMLHPRRIDPSTKMPRLSDDRGKTPLGEVFGGDAREQFHAIWHHLVR